MRVNIILREVEVEHEHQRCCTHATGFQPPDPLGQILFVTSFSSGQSREKICGARCLIRTNYDSPAGAAQPITPKARSSMHSSMVLAAEAVSECLEGMLFLRCASPETTGCQPGLARASFVWDASDAGALVCCDRRAAGSKERERERGVSW